MSETALRFENIGKVYRLGSVGTGSLTRDLSRWWDIHVRKQEDPYFKIGEVNDRSKKGKSDVVWALRDINFDVNSGEIVGIIGKNGAGKSTLLKLVSRITTPSTGVIKVRGRIASLLEVGTGFHSELTGRENIYMSGTVMGMTKQEINRKFDAIVDFAGVERYIDTPVKRYSSGMFVRLGFAIAAFLEPEILVVDEVLAVGDAEFKRKALGKMHDISTDSGRTVLFVSHNMASIKNLCTRGIVLDCGTVAFMGNATEAVDFYQNSNKTEIEGRLVDSIQQKKIWLEIDRIELNGTEERSSFIESGQQCVSLVIEGRTSESFRTDPMLILKNSENIPLATLAEGHYLGKIEYIEEGPFRIEREIILPKFLANGNYIVDLALHHPMIEYQMLAPGAAELRVEGYFEEGGRALNLREEGVFGLQTK